MKTIFTGPSKTTFHKEELGMSKAEKDLQKRISKNATGAQKKLTSHGKDSKDVRLYVMFLIFFCIFRHTCNSNL